MSVPQTGIFALGDAAHLFLEFSALPGVSARRLVEAVAEFHEPRTTVGGMNLVVGFRPELLREVAPHETPTTHAASTRTSSASKASLCRPRRPTCSYGSRRPRTISCGTTAGGYSTN